MRKLSELVLAIGLLFTLATALLAKEVTWNDLNEAVVALYQRGEYTQAVSSESSTVRVTLRLPPQTSIHVSACGGSWIDGLQGRDGRAAPLAVPADGAGPSARARPAAGPIGAREMRQVGPRVGRQVKERAKEAEKIESP